MRKIGEKNTQRVLNKSNQVSRDKLAQQEMIGFVLIVVVVVVALMIFLVISMRKTTQVTENQEIENILSSLLDYTTNCTINDIPNNVNQLINSCYKNRVCANSNLNACDSLEKELDSILIDLYKTESVYSGYEFSILILDNSSSVPEKMYEMKEGNCTGSSRGGLQLIPTSDRNVKFNVVMKFCN